MKSWSREPEAAGHRASAARKQREMNAVLGLRSPFSLAQYTFFHLSFLRQSLTEAGLADLTRLIGYLLPHVSVDPDDWLWSSRYPHVSASPVMD